MENFDVVNTHGHNKRGFEEVLICTLLSRISKNPQIS